MSVIRREDAVSLALSQGAVLEATMTGQISAVVYDMEPGGGESAVAFVKAVHSARSDWPVWLYYIPRAAQIEQVAEAASLRGVWATPQLGGLGQEGDLRVQVRRLLTSLPRARLLALLDSILRMLPAPVIAFLQASLQQVDSGGSTRVKVQDVTAGRPTTLRHLERICQATALPGPKQLLDHLLLLFFSYKALFYDVPLPRAAEHGGLGPSALRGLAHRAYGRDAQWAELEPRSRFDFALMALADVCNVPRCTAEEIVQKAAGERWA
jgi:hypothetical protein